MSSFGVKNVVRIDIFTHDIYILTTVRILLIIFEKNPQFSCLCTNIIAKEIAVSRTKEHKAFEMPNCMKQHLNVFLRGRKVMCKEYLCNCGSCLNYWFQDCLKSEEGWIWEDMPYTKDLDENHETDNTDQAFRIDEVPCVTLFTGTNAELL